MSTSNNNFDALLYANADALIEEDAKLLQDMDVSDVQISPETDKKIRRMIKRKERQGKLASVTNICRRIAAVFLVVCSIGFVFCMSIHEVRAHFMSMFFNWKEQFVEVYYNPTEEPPSIIEDYREPLLQLVGMEKQIIAQTVSDYIITYWGDDNMGIFYQQTTITHNSVDIDSEECVVTDININNCDATLFEYENGVKTLTWHDNEYAYIISVDPIDMETDILISIAESVK